MMMDPRVLLRAGILRADRREDASHVGIEHLVVRGVVVLGEGTRGLDARVVERDVEPTERRHRERDEGLVVSMLGHVRHSECRTAALPAQLARERLSLFAASSAQDDRRAACGEQYRGGTPDARCSPRDEHDLVRKRVHDSPHEERRLFTRAAAEAPSSANP